MQTGEEENRRAREGEEQKKHFGEALCLDSVARRAAPRRGLSGAITKSELHSPEEQRDLVIVRSDPKAREVTKIFVFLVTP